MLYITRFCCRDDIFEEAASEVLAAMREKCEEAFRASGVYAQLLSITEGEIADTDATKKVGVLNGGAPVERRKRGRSPLHPPAPRPCIRVPRSIATLPLNVHAQGRDVRVIHREIRV